MDSKSNHKLCLFLLSLYFSGFLSQEVPNTRQPCTSISNGTVAIANCTATVVTYPSRNSSSSLQGTPVVYPSTNSSSPPQGGVPVVYPRTNSSSPPHGGVPVVYVYPRTNSSSPPQGGVPVVYPRTNSSSPPQATDPPTRSPTSYTPPNGSIGSPNLNISPTAFPPTNTTPHVPDPRLHNRTSNHIGIILGVVFSAIAFIVAFILIFWCRKRRSSGSPTSSNVEKALLQQGLLAPKRYKYSEIKKITKSFNDKLGRGGFGTVYKGTLLDGSDVAVKVLNETDSNGEEFINEVVSISRTSHVNVVNLLGFCHENNKRALVYEFMPNKSLDKFIGKEADKKSQGLDMEKLYKIAIGVAKGLEYLHTGCNTKIVHFDIKPQNILLDKEFCPKISDFGLAKLCKTKKSIVSVLGMRGTAGYIAPEVFYRNNGGVSQKCDVYSYGMMVLEMIGATDTVQIETIQSSENYFPDNIYEKVVCTVTGEVDVESMKEIEDESVLKMTLVGLWCIQMSPLPRPTMSKVVEMLEGNLKNIPIPPKPTLCDQKLSGEDLSTHEEVEESNEC